MHNRLLLTALLLAFPAAALGCASQDAMLSLPSSCTSPQFTFLERADRWVDTTIHFSCPKSEPASGPRPGGPHPAPGPLRPTTPA